MATALSKLLYDEAAQTPTQAALSPLQPLTAPSLKIGAGTPAKTTPPATTAVQPISLAMPSAATSAPVAPDQGGLAKWGYAGPLGTNDYEQEYLKYIADLYNNQDALKALAPAQGYYDKALSGGFGPESDAYLQAVLDPMRASEMQNYDALSKALAGRYSSFGGYYGGRSGIAQGRLASDTANNMAQQEANLRYQAYMDNINRMSGAATGLQGLSGEMSGLQNNYLSNLLGGGNLLTGREQYNTQEYQNAILKEYQDWVRARQEQLLPYSIAQSLLGTNAQENVVTQNPGILNTILGVGGQIGAAALL